MLGKVLPLLWRALQAEAVPSFAVSL